MSKTLTALVLLTCTGLASAQEIPSPSPGASASQRVGITDVKIEYSTPGVKGRKIFGELVPFDKLWRTGANAATKLTVSRDFALGGKPVKAGSYALYTIPGAASWTVLLNSNANTGGTNGYDEKNDVARITVTPTALAAPRERMAFVFSDTTEKSVSLDLEWEKLRVSIPLTVDTAAFVQKEIDEATGDAWRPHFASARYLLDSGGDLNTAMTYIDKSIAIKPTWWNNWVKAQIHAKKGQKKEATAAGRAAQGLGKGDQTYENFFKADIEKAIASWK